MNTDAKSQLAAAAEVWADKEARREIRANPGKHARQLGMDVEGKEVVVATCDKDTFYLPLERLGENGELSEAQLQGVHAARRNAHLLISVPMYGASSPLYRRILAGVMSGEFD